MSVREFIEKHRKPVTISSIVAVVGGLSYAVYSVTATGPVMTSMAYFATDDGSAPFADSPDKLPPFDHGGKPAYRAAVYSCDGGKTLFIGYLQRYTQEAKARIEQRIHDPKIGLAHAMAGIAPGDVEIKFPGATKPWVSQADVEAAAQVTSVHCPDGGSPQPELP